MDIPDCVNRPRGPWAAPPVSRGRLHSEQASPTRTDYQRDRDRIVHSTAFRRLKHKTQVFVAAEGDHYRTRLTHSIEVAQIARSLARSLALDEDLAEALALAHDLGHTPFGHTGEDALNAAMRAYGGFDHNAQSLRLVTCLERRYAAFDGLNLSWETLEGLVKHNGPLVSKQAGSGAGAEKISPAILAYNTRHDLGLGTYASAEAQAAAISDDIAYNAHDLDDGLRAGLFSLDDIASLPLVSEALADIRARYPKLDEARAIHELMRRVITAMVEDVIETGASHFRTGAYRSSDDVRHASSTLVGFSPSMQAADRAIKAFLFENMYRHPEVTRVRDLAGEVVSRLFRHFLSDFQALPAPWQAGLEHASEAERALRVADYIAGMTDTFALDEHRRLFGVAPALR